MMNRNNDTYLEWVQLVREALVDFRGHSSVLLDQRLQQVLLLAGRDVENYRYSG